MQCHTNLHQTIGEFLLRSFFHFVATFLSQLYGSYLIFQADLANMEAPSKCVFSIAAANFFELWNSEQKFRDDEIKIKCVCLKTVYVYRIHTIHDEHYDLLWDYDFGVPEVQTNPSYRGN